MLRSIILLIFGLGILGYVGYYSYNRIFDLALASGSVNYYSGSKNASHTEIMTLKSCRSGPISIVPAFNAQIEVVPQSAKLGISGKLKIINGDDKTHTIGIALTKYWEEIAPGDSFEITYDKLPKSGTWGIICDNLNLGDSAPVIIVEEL